MLVLGLVTGQVIVMDEVTGKPRWEVQAHPSMVQVAMPPNGRFVASVGFYDDAWKIWGAASGEVHTVAATHDGTGSCICEVDFALTGRRVLEDRCPVIAHTAGLRAVAFSPCGQRLATRGSDGAVILWDARTGEAEQRMKGMAGEASAIAFSADGARVASGSGNTSLDVFDATTGALLRTIEQDFEQDEVLTCVSFSPTALSILATAAEYPKIHVWDIDSGDMIREIAGCFCVAIFSPDGRTIATTSCVREGEVQLMDAESGEMRVTMDGHGNTVNTASFSQDGSKLAAGGEDGFFTVWDSSTGALLHALHIEDEVIDSLEWGRDWVRATQTGVAFAMGHHPRLGAGSQVLELEAGVVRMILDRV